VATVPASSGRVGLYLYNKTAAVQQTADNFEALAK
jgi:hypothetical protein